VTLEVVLNSRKSNPRRSPFRHLVSLIRPPSNENSENIRHFNERFHITFANFTNGSINHFEFKSGSKRSLSI